MDGGPVLIHCSVKPVQGGPPPGDMPPGDHGMGEPGPMDGGPGGDPMGEPGPMDPGMAMQSHMDDAAAHAPGDPKPEP